MREAAERPVELIWRNEAGGLTGRVRGPEPRYLKWNLVGSGESLVTEARRLAWLAVRHPVPEVIELRAGGDEELLVTRAVPAASAVADRWREEPDAALEAIATGLRRLHSLPVGDCPFDWGVPFRLAQAAAGGTAVPEELRSPPPVDRLVVCHGDACAPNTLIGTDGRFAATVDVARLGLADRWADLAVATMSLAWNYGTYDEDVFWRAYGVEPDAERIDYYRRLWQAT